MKSKPQMIPVQIVLLTVDQRHWGTVGIAPHKIYKSSLPCFSVEGNLGREKGTVVIKTKFSKNVALNNNQ